MLHQTLSTRLTDANDLNGRRRINFRTWRRVFLAQTLAVVVKFLEDGARDWNHHSCTGRVAQPHRQETSHRHEAKQDPSQKHSHTHTPPLNI